MGKKAIRSLQEPSNLLTGEDVGDEVELSFPNEFGIGYVRWITFLEHKLCELTKSTNPSTVAPRTLSSSLCCPPFHEIFCKLNARQAVLDKETIEVAKDGRLGGVTIPTSSLLL
jgi:hypothetical protein